MVAAQYQYYTSNAAPTTLSSSLGSSGNPSVASITGLPSSLPYKMLIDWGLTTQEAILVTSAPTGSGPYSLPCTRGFDGTTAQAHSATASVVHGVSADEFNILASQATSITSKRWGADPTGTVDSTAAIQAAWESGLPVYAPAGDYLVNTGGVPLVWQAGLVFFGPFAGTYPGEDTITGVAYLHRAASANVDVIQVPDGTNYGRMQDIAIDGNKANNTSGFGINVEDGASGQETQIIFERVFSHDNPNSNIYLGNNRRANKVQFGVYNYSGSGDGITVCGSDNLIMSNITGSNARAGINLGSTVTQNWASFGSNLNSTTTHVFNNDVYGNLVGIAVPQNATRSMIIGNGVDRNLYQGLTVYNDDCNVISGNAFHSNGQQADNTYAHVDLASGVTAVVLNDNTFGPVDSGVTNLCTTCVNVASWSSSGIITGNIGQADTIAADTHSGLINSQANTPPATRLSNAGMLVQGSGNDIFNLRNSSGTLITKVTNGGTLVHSGGAFQLSGHLISLLSTVPGVANGTYCTGSAITSDSGDMAGIVSATMVASPAAGSLIVVTFHTAFTNTPAMTITPSNIFAAQIAAYVTVTNTGFTISAATTPPAGVDSQSVAWDYVVVGQNA